MMADAVGRGNRPARCLLRHPRTPAQPMRRLVFTWRGRTPRPWSCLSARSIGPSEVETRGRRLTARPSSAR